VRNETQKLEEITKKEYMDMDILESVCI